jgi:anthranilate synthase component 2
MSKHIILLDNYDSFTYNLYDYLCRLNIRCTVVRNDKLTVAELLHLKPDALLLSPGPKRPENAGILTELVQALHDKIPILGVCLGHQAIGAFFGAKLVKADLPMHGKTSMINHHHKGIFLGMPSPMQVMRYHSLLLIDLPDELEAIAFSENGEIMAMKHRKWPLWGLQFHPESILTPDGLKLLNNWVQTLKS